MPVDERWARRCVIVLSRPRSLDLVLRHSWNILSTASVSMAIVKFVLRRVLVELQGWWAKNSIACEETALEIFLWTTINGNYIYTWSLYIEDKVWSWSTESFRSIGCDWCDWFIFKYPSWPYATCQCDTGNLGSLQRISDRFLHR